MAKCWQIFVPITLINAMPTTMTMKTWTPTARFVVRWVSPEKLISFFVPRLSLWFFGLQTSWVWILITVLFTPEWHFLRRIQINANKINKRRWKPQRFGPYQTRLSAQLRHDVPTSIGTGRGCVENCGVRRRKRRYGIQMWGTVEKHRIPEPTVSKTE